MITAYPINSWMVSKGLKHGMMSAIPGPKVHNDGMFEPMEKDMKSLPENMKNGHASTMSVDGIMDMSGGKQHNHPAVKLSISQSAIVLIGTFAVLVLSMLLTARFAPITFAYGG